MAERHDDETGSSASSSDEDDGPIADAAGREEDWEEWEGGADEEDEDVTKSLFEDVMLPSPEAAMQHDAERNSFDLRRFAVQTRLDEYGIMRLINYIRTEVAAGRDPRDALAAAAAAASGPGAAAAPAAAHPWSDDRFLMPAAEDDALLCFDFEDVAAEAAAAAASGAGTGAGWVSRLRAENEALRVALEAMRSAFLPEELQEGDAEGPSTSTGAAASAPDQSGASTSGPASASDAPASDAAASPADPEAAAAASASAAAAAVSRRKVDAAYFESYSYFDIHREMLGDKPRTEAYRQALELNPALLRGATVLDVGAGTGILSLFACRAGAARVVAVDGSERIAGFARQHAELAGYSDSQGGPMTVVAGRVEELGERMPVKQ
ncbi:putative protein arginine N-methyltransferase 3, partial [Tetrabaena socialis]